MASQQEKEQPWNKELCVDIRWAPDLGLSMGLPGASRAVKERLSPAQEMTSDDIDVLIGLRRVCVYFCHDTLQALTDQDIANLEWHHVKFHGWMKDMVDLAASRRLGPDSDTWACDSP